MSTADPDSPDRAYPCRMETAGRRKREQRTPSIDMPNGQQSKRESNSGIDTWTREVSASSTVSNTKSMKMKGHIMHSCIEAIARAL